MGWTHGAFEIPAEVYEDWNAKADGELLVNDWNQRFDGLCQGFPCALAAEFTRRMAGELPANFAEIAVQAVAAAHDKAETVASRKASQIALEFFTAAVPEMLGGSRRLDRFEPDQHQEHPGVPRGRRRQGRDQWMASPVAISTTACVSSAWPQS
jgi:transketolase